MKSLSNLPLFVLFIAIVFSIAYVPSIKGHTVWVHNKLLPGSQAAVFAYPGPDTGREIAYGWSIAHKGFHLDINLLPNETEYYLKFKVVGTRKPQQIRGPYDNSKDICWRFTGSIVTWHIHDDC
ncbi:hypothetical protein C2G38_2039610 [Gigaspora rosea]|uniref:Uncharacterized protein n=1 Tax=Gigaspora rosea TaxID=44941 RepID=A0A397V0P0_9GLOM|nr:hypothetical protein C2G38_2039610 [Gigaspora rosea]CAG8454407.1 10418_t:CDS:2 [Gigaspora rosea]